MIKKVKGWNPYITVLENENRVIIANRWNGQWMKISKECFDIILEILKKDAKEIAWEDIFADDDDMEYIRKVFNNLIDMDILKKEEDYFIESVYISLTHKCNLRCIHCSVNAGIEESDILDTDEIKNVIHKLENSKVKTIIFTGGEPLVRNDIFDILKYARRSFSGKIVLMTNGTLINKDNVKELTTNLNAIDISIDGVDESTCSIIRGRGVFDKVMQAVELLHNNSFFNIALSMVSSIENNKNLETFYALNKKLETKAVVRVFCERGRGKLSKDKFVEVLPNDNVQPSITDKEYEEMKKELYDQILACSCGAGHKQLHINHDGKIYPCSLLVDESKYLLGDIRKIIDINQLELKNSRGMKNVCKIQPESYENCKNCNVNVFCWNCLEQIDRIGGTIEFRERCKSIKSYLEDVVWGSD